MSVNRNLPSFRRIRAVECMPLPVPVSRRALKHVRSIQIEAFARDDGLWDIDANIRDVKTFDAKLATGLRPAGEPVHDLSLRITIDNQLTIVDAQSSSDAAPYPGICENHGDAYKKLIGLSLVKGLRQKLQERLSGIQGCTHLTELAQILPTAAIQAVSGLGFYTRNAVPATESETRPFQLGHCHALRLDGPAVAKFYPKWAASKAKDGSNG